MGRSIHPKQRNCAHDKELEVVILLTDHFHHLNHDIIGIRTTLVRADLGMEPLRFCCLQVSRKIDLTRTAITLNPGSRYILDSVICTIYAERKVAVSISINTLFAVRIILSTKVTTTSMDGQHDHSTKQEDQ